VVVLSLYKGKTMVCDDFIRINKNSKKILKRMKIYDRETYNDVILRLIKENGKKSI